MRLRIWLILIVLFTILLSIKAFGNEENDLARTEGLLIYGNWEAYVYAFQDDKIHLQIPVYDFSNELTGYAISLDNFSIGEVENIYFELRNDFNDYRHYILHLTLIPKEPGQYSLSNLTITIQTDKNNYTESLGHWIFEIDTKPEETPLQITGGSLFTQFGAHYDTFEHRSTIKNTSTEKISLNEIQINHKRIKVAEISYTTILNPATETDIKTEIDITATSGNVYVQPKLVYTHNNQTMTLPLNHTIHSSVVSYEELLLLAKQKGLIQ